MKFKSLLGILFFFFTFLPSSKATTTAYIANFGSDTLSALNTISNTITGTSPAANAPYDVAVNLSGTEVFITNFVDNTVSVLNTLTNMITDTIAVGDFPTGITLNPAGTFVYVANENSNNIYVINTTTHLVTTTIPVGSSPAQIAFNLSGTTAYVSNSGNNRVSVINTNSNTVTNTIVVGTSPTGIAVHPAGTFAYAVNNGSNSVSVINTTTNSVTQTIGVGSQPLKTAVNPTGTRLYVTNSNDDTVSVINTATNTLVTTISVGDLPYFIAISSDGANAYVTNYSAGTLSVINLSNNTVTATRTVGSLPQGISQMPPDVPEVELSSSNLNFGDQLINTTSAVQTVTLTNTGTATLTLNNISDSGDYSQVNDCGATLLPSAQCTLSITFTPTTLGLIEGTIEIESNAFSSPDIITLQGTGISRTADLSPTTLDFGAQKVGTTSSAQTVTLTNTGTSTLTLTSIATSGDFSQSNNCGGSVEPNNFCNINVTFTPTSGVSSSGLLTIESNSPSSPQSVTLSGMGTVTSLSLSSSSLTFVSPTNGNSASQTVTLTNIGNETLTITSIAASRDFLIFHTCEESIAPGSGCEITVSFQSTNPPPTSGTITIISNANSTPNIITLNIETPNATSSCALTKNGSTPMFFTWGWIFIPLIMIRSWKIFNRKEKRE